MSKHFLINPYIDSIGSENVSVLEEERIGRGKNIWEQRERQAEKAMQEECPLKYVHGRAIVKVDTQKKNQHTFSSGLTIRRERAYNNFNFREVNPSNAIVISAEHIPEGAEVLIDYTAIHDSNKVFSYKSSSPDIVFYSIREGDCYAYRIGNDEWKPTKDCEFGLRVFRPYEGMLSGIEPKIVKNVLFITTGKLKNKVALVLKASDYQIVFTDENGREANLIRVRHSDKQNYDMEEIVGIHHGLTEQVIAGELLIGLTPTDAKIYG